MKDKLVLYRNLKYNKITPSVEEIACSFITFAKNNIKRKTHLFYSLHTEYSIDELNEKTILELKKYNFLNLANCQKSKKANLWCSLDWTLEFIEFINYIVNNFLDKVPPTIIEIHPPYTTKKIYNNTINNFFENYSIFEYEIKKNFKDTLILIENRNSGGNFLLSKSNDYINFVEYIKKNNLDLKLIVDIPQLYGKMEKIHKGKEDRIVIDYLINDLLKCTDFIYSFHISGKGHQGNFDTLFRKEKDYFLLNLKKLTDKIHHSLYVVPEINGQDNFERIMLDLEKYNIFNFN